MVGKYRGAFPARSAATAKPDTRPEGQGSRNPPIPVGASRSAVPHDLPGRGPDGRDDSKRYATTCESRFVSQTDEIGVAGSPMPPERVCFLAACRPRVPDFPDTPVLPTRPKRLFFCLLS